MPMLNDMNVTVGRELTKEDPEYGSIYMSEKEGDPQYLVADNATGEVYVAYRSEVKDYNWPSDPRRIPPPPKHPVYRNPHHPADHIPVDPLDAFKNPERQDLGWPEVETVEETLARHRNNPNQRWNQPPAPAQTEALVLANRREARVKAIDAGVNPDSPDQLAGAGTYTAIEGDETAIAARNEAGARRKASKRSTARKTAGRKTTARKSAAKKTAARKTTAVETTENA